MNLNVQIYIQLTLFYKEICKILIGSDRVESVGCVVFRIPFVGRFFRVKLNSPVGHCFVFHCRNIFKTIFVSVR